MALEDRDIFAAICSRCSDQPIEFIMEQYEKAKRINMDIEKRIDNGDTVEESPECALAAAEIIEKVESPKKKYTRRKLKIRAFWARPIISLDLARRLLLING